MQPVSKVPTTDILGFRKLSDQSGKENKSLKEIAAIVPNTSYLYPRRPPRSVYTSTLISNDLIFEKRYKPKINASRRATPKDGDKAALNMEPINALGSRDKVQNTESKLFQYPYRSSLKINPSYDLDRLAKKMLASKKEASERDVVGGKLNTAPTPEQEYRETPPMSPPIDVKRSEGVKKLVEKFSQTSLISSPNRTPVRTPLNFKKFNRSPLASSTVKSPVKLVVPKLYHITEPSKPEFRDVISETDTPRVGTPEVLAANLDSKSAPALPAFETLPERPEAGFTEDSNMRLSSSDSVGDALADETLTVIQDTNPNEFLSLRTDNTEKYRGPVIESSMAFQTLARKPLSYNAERIRRLTMEASVQRSLVAQTSKALYFCRTAKQFRESRELVEGERILLLASLRSRVAQEEIYKCSLPPSNSASSGSLTISDIFVPLKWDVFPKLDRNICPQWFLCVCILGETVQATEVVQLVDNQPVLKFQASMHFSELCCDFRARLQLYAFRVPHQSHKKSKIVQACKMLRRPTRHCLGPVGSTEELIYMRNPAFTLTGGTELTVGLIGQQQPVSCSLEQVPTVSLIKGTINFRLSAQLLNTRQLSGFLNVLRPAVGEGRVAAWQRWWCHLDGKALRCWNYPSDQEEKVPVFSIDLLQCLSEKVVPAPRVLCSRPRTLMLESQRSRGSHDLDSTHLAWSPDSTIVRHFLSCDSAADMAGWSSAINECLEALHLWNIVPETQRE